MHFLMGHPGIAPMTTWRLSLTFAWIALASAPACAQPKDDRPREWQDAEKEADKLDPGWRFADIQAARAKVPDKENSALHIIRLAGKERSFRVSDAADYDTLFDNVPANAQLNDQQARLIRQKLAKVARPLAEARKLKDMPRGRYPVQYTDDYYINTPLAELECSRMLAEWLEHDAYLMAQDKNLNAAVSSCRAALNAGRAIGDELNLLTFMWRTGSQRTSAAALERVLAQGELAEKSLEEMQALLELEIKQSNWLHAMRGERAGFHMLSDNVRTGKVKAAVLRDFPPTPPGAPDPTENEIRAFVVQSFPPYLRRLTQLVEIARLPGHQQFAKIDEFLKSIKRDENRFVQLMPGMWRGHRHESLGQAMMRSAMVAVACERYRLKHKQWPESLDALVKERLLAAIPPDPMDGQSLRFRRTEEGIVIYSIGLDRKDDKGNIDRRFWRDEQGVDIGFRLWNVDRRRQPALPPVKLEN
jgi:hypothetical protein